MVLYCVVTCYYECSQIASMIIQEGRIQLVEPSVFLGLSTRQKLTRQQDFLLQCAILTPTPRWLFDTRHFSLKQVHRNIHELFTWRLFSVEKLLLFIILHPTIRRTVSVTCPYCVRDPFLPVGSSDTERRSSCATCFATTTSKSLVGKRLTPTAALY